MRSQDTRTSRLEEVEDDFGYLQTPNSMKRLPERDNSTRRQIKNWDILSDSVNPTHVLDSRPLATPPPFLQHAYFGIERYHLLKRSGQCQLQHARSASHVEKLASAVKRQFVRHDACKLSGVRRTPNRVVLSGSLECLRIELHGSTLAQTNAWVSEAGCRRQGVGGRVSEGRLAQSPTGGSNRGPMEREGRKLHFNGPPLRWCCAA